MTSKFMGNTLGDRAWGMVFEDLGVSITCLEALFRAQHPPGRDSHDHGVGDILAFYHGFPCSRQGELVGPGYILLFNEFNNLANGEPVVGSYWKDLEVSNFLFASPDDIPEPGYTTSRRADHAHSGNVNPYPRQLATPFEFS
jgi:hypothetical protein